MSPTPAAKQTAANDEADNILAANEQKIEAAQKADKENNLKTAEAKPEPKAKPKAATSQPQKPRLMLLSLHLLSFRSQPTTKILVFAQVPMSSQALPKPLRSKLVKPCLLSAKPTSVQVWNATLKLSMVAIANLKLEKKSKSLLLKPKRA